MDADLTKDIDVTTDGEYADEDEVKIVMTGAQADALARILADGVARNGIIGTADRNLATDIAAEIRAAREIAREAAEAS